MHWTSIYFLFFCIFVNIFNGLGGNALKLIGYYRILINHIKTIGIKIKLFLREWWNLERKKKLITIHWGVFLEATVLSKLAERFKQCGPKARNNKMKLKFIWAPHTCISWVLTCDYCHFNCMGWNAPKKLGWDTMNSSKVYL